MLIGLAREIIALTMLGKVGTSVSDLDELYKRWRFKEGKVEENHTPVPLSTTKGAEGSILIVCREYHKIAGRSSRLAVTGGLDALAQSSFFL